MSLICHSYVTRMYLYITRMSLVSARMSSVCHSYVLVCHPHVTRMYSYVIRMSLLCTCISSVCHLYVVLPWTKNNLFKDFCKVFLNKQKLSNKASFFSGDLNLNTLDYDTNEVVKTFLIWFFRMDSYPSYKDLRELLEQAPLEFTHILTNRVLKNKIQSSIIKTDISDHFEVLSVLTRNKICSLKKNKIYQAWYFRWK